VQGFSPLAAPSHSTHIIVVCRTKVKEVGKMVRSSPSFDRRLASIKLLRSSLGDERTILPTKNQAQTKEGTRFAARELRRDNGP